MENLKNCINNDLANNYGNLCQRVFSFVKKNCNNKIPKADNLKEVDLKLIDNIKSSVPSLINLINKQDLNSYLKMIVSFSFEANKYFNDSEPWTYKMRDPKRMNTILYTIIEQIKNISILLYPIIPNSTQTVLDTLNISQDKFSIENVLKDNIFNHNQELKNLDILFKKIENDN